MRINNPRRLGLVLAGLVVVIVVVVGGVLALTSSTKQAPQVTTGVNARVFPPPSSSLPPAVNRIVQATNSARRVVIRQINGPFQQRTVYQFTSTAEAVSRGSLVQSVDRGNITWTRAGDCRTITPALGRTLPISAVLPLTQAAFRITDRDGTKMISWRGDGVNHRLSGTLTTDDHDRVIQATISTGTQTLRYQISYPQQLKITLPASHTCRGATR
jgi:hypothetical protein